MVGYEIVYGKFVGVDMVLIDGIMCGKCIDEVVDKLYVVYFGIWIIVYIFCIGILGCWSKWVIDCLWNCYDDVCGVGNVIEVDLVEIGYIVV